MADSHDTAKALETAEQLLTRRNARRPWFRKKDGIQANIEGWSGESVLYRWPHVPNCEVMTCARPTFEALYEPELAG